MGRARWCFRCQIAVAAPCDDLCDYHEWPDEDVELYDDETDPGEWEENDLAIGLGREDGA